MNLKVGYVGNKGGGMKSKCIELVWESLKNKIERQDKEISSLQIAYVLQDTSISISSMSGYPSPAKVIETHLPRETQTQ